MQMDLEFGKYRLKRAERLLLGPKGPVELSGRSFDILAMLLERPDEVIGKTELFDIAWPGLVVEENTLQVHVSALRKALDPGMIRRCTVAATNMRDRGQSRRHRPGLLLLSLRRRPNPPSPSFPSPI